MKNYLIAVSEMFRKVLFREENMPLMDVTRLQYDSAGDVRKMHIQNFVDTEVFVLRLKKGYTIPIHQHSTNVIEVLMKGEINFIEHDGESAVMKSGMLRSCGSKPYEARVLEDSYILVVQPKDSSVIVDRYDESLSFFSQKVLADAARPSGPGEA